MAAAGVAKEDGEKAKNSPALQTLQILNLKSQSDPVNNPTNGISWHGKGWWISIAGLDF